MLPKSNYARITSCISFCSAVSPFYAMTDRRGLKPLKTTLCQLQ